MGEPCGSPPREKDKGACPDRRGRSKVSSRFAESASAFLSASYFKVERGPVGTAKMCVLWCCRVWLKIVSFQVSILKILAGQPGGRASLAVLKDYLAVFYSSGPDWADRMKRLAARAPDLNIFGQGLVTREPGHWIITEKGLTFLTLLEQTGGPASEVPPPEGGSAEKLLVGKLPVLAPGRQGHGSGRHRRRRRERTRDGRAN